MPSGNVHPGEGQTIKEICKKTSKVEEGMRNILCKVVFNGVVKDCLLKKVIFEQRLGGGEGGEGVGQHGNKQWK